MRIPNYPIDIMPQALAAASAVDTQPSQETESAAQPALDPAVAHILEAVGLAQSPTSAQDLRQESPEQAPDISAELEQMRPDPIVSKILTKARRGKSLSPAELKFASTARPDQAGVLSLAAKEREALTRRMRQSRSKQEVRMAHLGAVVTAGKTSLSSGEADTRINQLTDAKVEYMRTKEYRQKPELPPKSLRRRPGEGTSPMKRPCSWKKPLAPSVSSLAKA